MLLAAPAQHADGSNGEASNAMATAREPG